MPFGKLSKRQFKRFDPERWARKKALNQPQRDQVAIIAKRVTGRKSETKYGTSQFSAVAFAANVAQLTDLTQIPQNNTNTGRIGSEVTPKSIQFRYSFLSTANAIYRVILFQWKPDTVTSAPAQGLLDIGVAGVTPDVYSQYNYNDRRTYVIIYDRTHRQANGLEKNYHSGQVFGKKLPEKMLYNVPAATTGESHLYLYVIADAAGAFNGVFRVMYKDA